MEIIILDINKKDKLLLKKQKKEVINCANLIASGRNIEIIESIENYDIKLRKIYKNNYPVYKKISFRDLSIQKLSTEIRFDTGDTIVLPYFNNTKYWVKIVIGDKEEFLKHMFQKGYFNSLSIICPNKKKIYDIELGEQEYEIRICNC